MFQSNLIERFQDVETRCAPLFYLLCKYRFNQFSPEQIRAYQMRRARRIARYAVAHSAFFKLRYKDADPDRFNSLPTVNKKLMMDHLGEYNTVGLTREEILRFCLEVEQSRDFSRRWKGLNIGMSSGTSGNKGVEIVTRGEEGYMRAAFLARFPWPRGERIRLAFILRVSAPAFRLDLLGHKLTYISQLTPIEEICAQVNRMQPNVIAGPPSMLKVLGDEVNGGRLAVKPKRLVSYAETLYPDVRAHLAQTFRCAVHEIYKCTEGPIAISCRLGNLHINEDLVLMETLNEDGTPTPPGEPCQRLLVTDLHKKSQPIIRYELNDIITLSRDRCACGSWFRVIEAIQGRADDVFRCRGGVSGRWQYIFPDYISRAIMTASDDIEEYQATQESPTEVAVTLQLRTGIDKDRFDEEAVVRNIQKVFATYGCPEPRVTIGFGRPEASSRSGKLTRIRRAFTVEEEGNAHGEN